MQPASSSPPAASAPLSDASCSSLPRVGVLLIGSGPASLSLLLRVLRPGLSDLWSEDEAQRGGRHATSTKHTQPNDDDECNANHTQQQQQQQHSRSTAPASATMHHSPIPTLTVEQVRDLVAVLDPLPSWCNLWHRHFAALRIAHLRSTILAHPCPVDPQSLRAFAAERGRNDEVRPLLSAMSVAQRTGKQLERKRDKEQRRKAKAQCDAVAQAALLSFPGVSPGAPVPFRRVTQSVSVWPRASLYDLSVPSSRLFRDFIRSLVADWNLDALRVRDTVRNVRRITIDDGSEWYLVELASGRRMLSWSVVCAVGNSVPRWPLWAKQWRNDTNGKGETHSEDTNTAVQEVPRHALLHSSELVQRCFEPATPSPSASEASTAASKGASASSVPLASHLPASLHTGRLLVVGGGLTSAQLACEVLRTAAPQWHVDWCIRGWLRVKSFDVDTEWVSPSTANMCMAQFHALDSIDEKIRVIRAARQGGSITHEAMQQVKQWTQDKRLRLREHTEVHKMEWISKLHDDKGDVAEPSQSSAGRPSASSGFWRVHLHRHDPSAIAAAPVCGPGSVSPCAVHVEVFECDAVWLCTGSAPDVRQHAFLRDLACTHAVHAESGLPIVDDHLRWTKNSSSAAVDRASTIGGAVSATVCARVSVPPPRFHFVGGLGCLHLGPDAFNLRGAQSASRNLFEIVRGYIRDAAAHRDTTGSATAAAATHAQHSTIAAQDDPFLLGGATSSVEPDGGVVVTQMAAKPTSLQLADRDCNLASVSARVVPATVPRPSAASCGLRATASSHRNQLSRGAKCLNCNLQRDPPRNSDSAANPFLALADDEEQQSDDSEREAASERPADL